MFIPMEWTSPLSGRRMIDSHPNHQICWDCEESEMTQLEKAFMKGVRYGRTEEQVAYLLKFQQMMIASALEEAITAIARGKL